MSDVVLLTPREVPTGASSLHNEQVVVSDVEYVQLDPVMRQFYEKVRENLGIGCLSTVLRQAGHSVRSLNLHGRHPSDDAVRQLLLDERPGMVGISVMYDLHITDAVRLAAVARETLPDVVVALGGAFCTYNASLIAEHLPEVDVVAFGEAERTIVDMVDAVAAGRSCTGVAGTVWRDGDRIVSGGPPVLPDLATLPWPARDTLVQHRAAGIPTPVASSYTSRGCHAKCTFCYAPRQPGAPTNPWRQRDVGDVVDELEHLVRDFGTRFVWFNDDNFGGAFAEGAEHAVAVAEELIRREVPIEFHCEFRVDSGLVDREVLAVLRRAGMASALLGIETGSPSMMRRLKKGTTVAYNLSAARLVQDAGIDLDPGWILIEPGTTVDELWENVAFLAATGAHRTSNPFFLVNRAIALRGTEMFDRIEPPEVDSAPAPGSATDAILAAARRDYRTVDPAVDALWEVWSRIGGEISRRRENEVPFLAQDLADATRRARREGRPAPMPLTPLRRWSAGLADLLLGLLVTGLMIADQRPEDLEAALDEALGTVVDTYDRDTLGRPYAEVVAEVRALADEPAASGIGA